MHYRKLVPAAALLLGLSGHAYGQAATMACKDESGRDGSCELDNRLNASIRIGLVVEDDDPNDTDFSVSNFGSRLRWGGETRLNNGLNGIGYLEFGVNPDQNDRGNSGVDRTRQAWVGLSGDFGSLKIGAQYGAFYDLISSYTDIAYWGSCWTQFECARQTRVLKYEGESGALSYAASFTANPGDTDNDPADEIEGGVNYTVGALTFGVAATVQADDDISDEEGGFIAEDDGGLLIGGVVQGRIDDDTTLALGLQFADEDYDEVYDEESGLPLVVEDGFNVTLAATYGAAYLVLNAGDFDDTSPYYGTLGYATLLDPASTIYYEAQIVDADDDFDPTLIARVVYIYNFESTVLTPMSRGERGDGEESL